MQLSKQAIKVDPLIRLKFLLEKKNQNDAKEFIERKAENLKLMLKHL